LRINAKWALNRSAYPSMMKNRFLLVFGEDIRNKLHSIE